MTVLKRAIKGGIMGARMPTADTSTAWVMCTGEGVDTRIGYDSLRSITGQFIECYNGIVTSSTTLRGMHEHFTREVRLTTMPGTEPVPVRVYPGPGTGVSPKDPVDDRTSVSSTYTSDTIARNPVSLPPEGGSSRFLLMPLGWGAGTAPDGVTGCTVGMVVSRFVFFCPFLVLFCVVVSNEVMEERDVCAVRECRGRG